MSCGVQSRITSNRTLPGACPWHYAYTRTLEQRKRKRKEKKRQERRKKKKNIKEKRTKPAFKAKPEGQGCCLQVQSVVRYVQLVDQYKDTFRLHSAAWKTSESLPVVYNSRRVLLLVLKVAELVSCLSLVFALTMLRWHSALSSVDNKNEACSCLQLRQPVNQPDSQPTCLL